MRRGAKIEPCQDRDLPSAILAGPFAEVDPRSPQIEGKLLTTVH